MTRSAGGGSVRITFTDTGRGMTPAQVERLFEPFSSSTTGGTGLGLSIVYQIIRDHGGTINVRSRRGTRHDHHDRTACQAGLGLHFETMANLLIVDDEQGMRQLLSLVFGRAGHAVRAAENGAKRAGAAARRSRPTSSSRT